MTEDRVEIRVLGTLHVRRPDGTTVAPREWRTTKTRDLLRILAVNAGTPVPTDQLLEALWPTAEPSKGRASLRTAASQVRQVIGRDCVARQFDGLVLQHAWVDAVAFASLAAEARHAFARGELSEGLAAAREAAGLYAGDLCADEPYAEWAFADRERLRSLRATLLAEAAEAALALGRLREAIRLAGQVLESDRSAERAYRVLMRAHFAIGETDSALRAYERCREALADELGVDPSQQTRALHLELLSTDPDETVRSTFTGRETEIERVKLLVAESLREEQGALVVVSGEEGSGRTRLADEACADWPDRLVRLRAGADEGGSSTLAGRLCSRLRGEPAGEPEPAKLVGALRDAMAAAAPLVVRLDGLEQADPDSIDVLRQVLTDLDRPVAVVATSVPLRDATSALRDNMHALTTRGRAVEVSLGPLSREAVDDLLADLLTERATPGLLEDAMAETQGHPGRIVRFVRDLSTAGRLTVTHQGVERLAPEAAGSEDVEGAVQRVKNTLTPEQLPVLDLVSVLGGSFSPAAVAGIQDVSLDQARAALDALADEGLLAEEGGRYRFRHLRVADAVYRWLRPKARRELHAKVAASPDVSEAARVEHWYAAGEPQLACGAALQAAGEAAVHDDHERQRAYLLRARSLTDMSETTPRDRLSLAESLGDACYGMARYAEAREAYEEAVAVAREHVPGEVARLSRKLGNAASRPGQPEALGWYRQALTETSDDPVERVRTTSAIGSMLALHSPMAADDMLRNAVGMADEVGDVVAQVEARVLLAARALAPRRQFAESQRWLQEALTIADTGEDDVLLAQALMAGKETTIALASSWQTVATLTRVDDVAGQGPRRAALRRDVRLLLALAAHELATPEFAWRWAASWTHADSVPHGGLWRWVPGRVLYERGHFAEAQQGLMRSLRGDQGALDFQLVRLPAARLAAERGDTTQAITLLREATERAVDTGVTLVLPEIAARLAALEATEDAPAGAARLEQAENALGEAVFAREQSAIMLARAALLSARGEPEAAADMAGAAAAASRAASMDFQTGEALTVQAGYLSRAGDQTRALATLRRAGELYEQAGAPARVRATSNLAGRLGLDWEAVAAG